jgi:hypothetical protein
MRSEYCGGVDDHENIIVIDTCLTSLLKTCANAV